MMRASLPLNIYYQKQRTMKKIMMAMSAALMLTACEKSEESAIETPTASAKTVTFTFGPEMRQMTRASLTELNITDLWLRWR